MRHICTVAALALVIGGCSVKRDDTATDGDVSAPEAASAPEPDRIAADSTAMPLDIAATHPDGMALQLHSIEARPTETILTLTMVNNADAERTLNGRNGGTYIFGPDGAKLVLSAPSTNTELAIPPGQSLQADLVFQGGLAQGGAATLITNNGEDAENRYSRYPGFRVSIPMQEAAFTKGGAKKKIK